MEHTEQGVVLLDERAAETPGGKQKLVPQVLAED